MTQIGFDSNDIFTFTRPEPIHLRVRVNFSLLKFLYRAFKAYCVEISHQLLRDIPSEDKIPARQLYHVSNVGIKLLVLRRPHKIAIAMI